jgi:hypothetical protein
MSLIFSAGVHRALESRFAKTITSTSKTQAPIVSSHPSTHAFCAVDGSTIAQNAL